MADRRNVFRDEELDALTDRDLQQIAAAQIRSAPANPNIGEKEVPR
jgi:hypothetical protein